MEITLVLAVLSIVASFFLCIKLLKIQMPVGHKFVYVNKENSNRVIIIVDKQIFPIISKSRKNQIIGFLADKRKIDLYDLAIKCCYLIDASRKLFEELDLVSLKKKNTIILYFVRDKSFNVHINGIGKYISSYSTNATSALKYSVPMIVVTEKAMNSITRNGQPLMDELMHVFSLKGKEGYLYNCNNISNNFISYNREELMKKILINWLDLLADKTPSWETKR